MISLYDRCENIFSGIDKPWSVQTTEEMASAVADRFDWSRNISRDYFLQTSFIFEEEDVSPFLFDYPVNCETSGRGLKPILVASVTTVGPHRMNTVEHLFSIIASIISILSFILQFFQH